MPTEAELRAITAQIVAAYLTKNATDAPLDLNDLKASVYDALVDCAGIKPWAAVADRVVPLADVAERFQLTERHVRNVVREHGIPVLGKHRTIRFDAEALAAFKEALRCRSSSPAAKTPAPSQLRVVSNSRMGRADAFDKLLSQRTPRTPPKKLQPCKPGSSARPSMARPAVPKPSPTPSIVTLRPTGEQTVTSSD